MMTAKTCVACGSSNLEPGTILFGGKPSFIPDKTKFWTLTKGVDVSAALCMDCGVIVLTANQEEASALLPEDNS